MRTQNQLTSFFAIVTLGLTVGTGCKNKDSAAATRPDSASMSASTTARPSQSPYGATGSASGSGGMTAGDSYAVVAATGVSDFARAEMTKGHPDCKVVDVVARVAK